MELTMSETRKVVRIVAGPVRWLLAASMILVIMGCAPVDESRQDASEAPPGVSWEGGSQSHTDATGATWTFPQDLSRNPDRGCVTWRGGDGIVRTNCW
jgi:hypothetical protein